MKCSRYFFSKDGKIIFTAKKKSNEIYIGHGNDIHIKGDGKGTCARIMQCDNYNIVYTANQEFRINYVIYGSKLDLTYHYSLQTSFTHEGMTASWEPREIDSYLRGEYDHVPISSKRNILLQNKEGVPTFAVRKMENNVFEIECLSSVDPLTAFVIGLSQVIGPFN